MLSSFEGQKQAVEWKGEDCFYINSLSDNI